MSDNKILAGDMSRKQCLEVLKRLLEVMEIFDGISPSPERINALKMAIASLETDEAYQLEYESTTKNDLGVDCNNCKNNFHRGDGTSYCATGDGMCHYECENPTTKNDLGVDAISRAEVLKLMQDNWHTHNGDWAMQESMDDIRALPPVTPKRPKGHWIEQIDHEENCRTLICSNCDRPALHDEDSIWKHRFCPHCGADMREVEE